ncbi:MAG: cyclic nucleotide-binding domain-containing protein [Myxococcales bacterium]|nr:cyclic nucleotide-binding domain-containing protein [Myxococcales bacterium]
MFGFGKKKRALASHRETKLFQGLSDAELEAVEADVRERKVAPGERVVTEGSRATELFIVAEGEVAIVRGEGEERRELGRLGPGEVVGEMALFDELPRAASVDATKPTRLWVVDFHDLRPRRGDEAVSAAGKARSEALRGAYPKLLENLAGVMADRVRFQNERLAEGARRHEAMGRFVISTLVLVCLYTFVLSGLDLLGEKAPANTTMVSLPIQIVFALGSVWFIRGSGYPLATFGLGFRHLLGSLVEAIIFTIPALLVVVAIKWLVIQASDSAAPLIAHPDVAARLAEPDVTRWLIIYTITCFVQELIVRGAIQSGLSLFVTGPRKDLWAIVVAALLFSMTHLHISFLFASLAFLPGLFWGWLYARRPNLLGVTLSHAVVGGFVFFIAGTSL